MKTTFTLYAGLALALCLLPLTANAQGHMMGSGQGGFYGHGMMNDRNMDQDSYAKWREVYEQYRQPMNQLSWKLRRTSAELGEMLSAETPDDKAVIRKAEEIGELQAQRYVLSVRMRLDLLKQGLDDWGGYGMGMMHGGMMGPGVTGPGMMGPGMMHGYGMSGQGMMYGPRNRGWPSGEGGY